MSDLQLSGQQEVRCFGYPATLQLTIPEGMQKSMQLSRKTPLLLRVLEKDRTFRFVLTRGTDGFKDMGGDSGWKMRNVEQIVIQERGSINIPKHLMHAAKLNGYTFFNISLTEGPLGEQRIMLDPGVLDELPEKTKSHLSRNRNPGGQYCTYFYKVRTASDPLPQGDPEPERPLAAEISWQLDFPQSLSFRTRLISGKLFIPDSILRQLGWSKGNSISFYALDGASQSTKRLILVSSKRPQDIIYPFDRDAYRQVGSNPVREGHLFGTISKKVTIENAGKCPYSQISVESDAKGKKILVLSE